MRKTIVIKSGIWRKLLYWVRYDSQHFFSLIYADAAILLRASGFFFDNCIFTDDVCPNENITFWLYTKSTINNPIQLNITDIPKNIFQQGKKLEILIHGYTGNKDFDPNPQIRPVLLNTLNLNVISVDYGPLAEEPCYIQAVYNLKIVAKCTALMINNLIKNNIFKNDDIHVIGFSLGAQTSGMLSNYVNQKLKRITGLDPAKPGFIIRGHDGKLDASDAEFVDIIHTDIFARGVLMPAGHVDFYLNAGYNQPGCDMENNTSIGSCNHARAPKYYAESITSEKGFYGYKCYNWLHFEIGLCENTNGSMIEEMGYYVSEDAEGSYFVTTNSQSPYAKGGLNSLKYLISQAKFLLIDNPFEDENLNNMRMNYMEQNALDYNSIDD